MLRPVIPDGLKRKKMISLETDEEDVQSITRSQFSFVSPVFCLYCRGLFANNWSICPGQPRQNKNSTCHHFNFLHIQSILFLDCYIDKQVGRLTGLHSSVSIHSLSFPVGEEGEGEEGEACSERNFAASAVTADAAAAVAAEHFAAVAGDQFN